MLTCHQSSLLFSLIFLGGEPDCVVWCVRMKNTNIHCTLLLTTNCLAQFPVTNVTYSRLSLPLLRETVSCWWIFHMTALMNCAITWPHGRWNWCKYMLIYQGHHCQCEIKYGIVHDWSLLQNVLHLCHQTVLLFITYLSYRRTRGPKHLTYDELTMVISECIATGLGIVGWPSSCRCYFQIYFLDRKALTFDFIYLKRDPIHSIR